LSELVKNEILRVRRSEPLGLYREDAGSRLAFCLSGPPAGKNVISKDKCCRNRPLIIMDLS